MVAVSKIRGIEIVKKHSNKRSPEVLRTVPVVYKMSRRLRSGILRVVPSEEEMAEEMAKTNPLVGDSHGIGSPHVGPSYRSTRALLLS